MFLGVLGGVEKVKFYRWRAKMAFFQIGPKTREVCSEKLYLLFVCNLKAFKTILNNKKALLKCFKNTFIQNTCSLFNNKKHVETAPTVGFEPRLLHFREVTTSEVRVIFINASNDVTVRLSYHTQVNS